MGKRLFKWFVFNVGFALLPLVTVVLFRDLAGKLTLDEIAKSPEILFFAIMVSATALGDLVEAIHPVSWDWRLGLLGGVLAVGAIFCAMLYGGLLYNSMQPDEVAFRARLLNYSVFLSAVLGITSTLAEILLGRIKDLG